MRISDWSSDVCSSDLVPQQNCSVLINTYTNHPGILRHGAQKSADASAFGEMLINDGIANEAQSGCHMEIAYAVRFPARSLYQRSEERRVGKECVSTGRSWGCPDH